MIALCAAALMTLQTPDPERDAAIREADAAIRAAVPVAAADPNRPLYHYRAPAQWMNDPNGPIFYKGWYHLFYQSTPTSADSGVKYWGHARSRDLVHWEDLPTALWPSVSQGENSIWSGSVFPRGDGKPVAFYTSIGDRREPEQWMATPEDDDLIRWRKEPLKITQAIHGASPTAEWRDPFLFNDFGLTYMVTGGGQNGRGVVNLYKATSPDLKNWQYLGVMFTHPDADVRNVECPNLVQVNGKWVLLTSVHGRVEAFVGELRNTTFVSERRSVLGDGSYASQIFAGIPDRAVEMAWVNVSGHKGWNGYLTLPSELRLAKNGALLLQPVKELTKLRGNKTSLPNSSLEGTLAAPEGETMEIEATIEPSTARRVGLRLGSGAFEVAYDPDTGKLSVGGLSTDVPGWSVAKGLKLRVFLDRTACDVYAGDGATTLVAHVDRVKGREASFFAEGGTAKLRNVAVYPISIDRK